MLVKILLILLLSISNILGSINQLPLNVPNNFIAGGQLAYPQQFPYQIGIKYKSLSDKGFCGGSMISDQFILTAAHCIHSADRVTVILGAFRMDNSSDDTEIRYDLNYTDFIIHENFNIDGYKNDIALIRLPNPINFTDTIQPVNLPKISDKKRSFLWKSGYISGWGQYDKTKKRSPFLRYAAVSVITNLKCKLAFIFQIEKTNICTGGVWRKGACPGDSGGALVIENDDDRNSRTIIGVISFGIQNGCNKNWPTVHTRVTSYLEWISINTGIELIP